MGKEITSQPPIILREGEYSKEDLANLLEIASIEVIDIYERQLKELRIIRNPATPDADLDLENSESGLNFDSKGNWVYLPWSNKVIHTVNEDEYFELRTNRNRNIITAEEQLKMKRLSVSIAGLSVGGNIATTLAYSGFYGTMRLADFDKLETTNLNRIRAGLSDVGRSKLDIIKEQIYNVNPYVAIEDFSEGLTQDNLSQFIGGNPRSHLVFEIIDNLKLKILLRLEAKKQGVPILMLTSIGDSLLIDIERYDTQPETVPFNGLVNAKDIEEILSDDFQKADENKYVIKLVDRSNIPTKVLESVKEIGTKLVGRPQVMSTITVEAGIAAYLARCIALDEGIPSGRFRVRFETFING